jgi:hypothetical protein
MTKETLWEGMVSGKPLKMVVENNTIVFEPLTEGLFANIASGAWGFAKAHPVISTIAGIAAVDAWKKYKDKINKTVKFQAKDRSERLSMEPVINQMVKSGYKIVKQAYKGASGYEWQLEKK